MGAATGQGSPISLGATRQNLYTRIKNVITGVFQPGGGSGELRGIVSGGGNAIVLEEWSVHQTNWLKSSINYDELCRIRAKMRGLIHLSFPTASSLYIQGFRKNRPEKKIRRIINKLFLNFFFAKI